MSAVPFGLHVTVATVARGRLEVQVAGSVRRDDDAEVFVGHVPVLHVYSQGRTEDEARRAIENAVRLYVKAAAERGLLDRILQRPGFRLGDDAGMPRQYIRRVDVVWRLRPEMPSGGLVPTTVPS